MGTIPIRFDERWNGASIPIEHWHFHRRLFSRYGIVLEPGEFSGIIKDIKKKRADLVQRKRLGAAVYLVHLRSSDALVYVLALGSRLLTAYPPQFEKPKGSKIKVGQRTGILDLPDGSQVRVRFRITRSGEDR
ncbi:hypothetical protein [Bradyrhizobium sp. 2TAF24]|uniref:hypothetical protein n=1 Tax=Bradyrhizobium sp. 2TAF24 TaxID=3233011 RepID=UPI003F8FE85D